MELGILSEGIHNLQAIDFSPVLHILGQEDGASGLFGGSHDQSIPEGKTMEAVKVDGGENVGDFGGGDVEFRQ
jgi:hypothetical protein